MIEKTYNTDLSINGIANSSIKNAGEIIEQLLPHISDISYRTYYRKRRDAISSLSCILWGYTERESLEVTKKFLQEK